jgi:hypothetical protein
MSKKNIPNIPTGQDAIKGGIFFGSALTPGGAFSNVPKTTTVDVVPTTAQKEKMILTLERVKEALKLNAKLEKRATDDVLSEEAINTFLNNYVQLLIDYSDLRNYVFFGSAYNELVYHINYLILNYPYKVYFAKNAGSNSVNPLNQISITYPGGNTSSIKFEYNDILFPASYDYTLSGETQWLDFEIVDSLNNRFKITNINFIDTVLNISNATNTSPIIITTTTNHGLKSGDIVTIEGVLGNNAANGQHQIQTIDIGPGIGVLTSGQTYVVISASATYDSNNYLQGDTFTANTNTDLNAGIVAPANQFRLVGTTGNGAYTTGGIIKLKEINITIDGVISLNNLIDYSPNVGDLYKGLIISPTLKAITDFELKLEGPQKELLNPNNPTPWPREPITNNIIIKGQTFETWIEAPTNLVSNYDPETLGLDSIEGEGLNLTGAITLDSTGTTNQLLVRSLPHRVVDELRDTDDKLFTRFVYLAGKLFDSIKVYIDFLKYTKSLNYTPFNQLSPEFYKLYAEHYGFDLFDEDNIDLAKSIIRTEPGIKYNNNQIVFSDTTNSKTLKELQYEKQKRLLINLFYLYQTKGTLKCVEQLVKLIGSPEGLVLFNEYVLNTNLSQREIDNDKVKIPKLDYEIDPDYLLDKVNISNPINLPYVYRLKLDNDDIVNLRELDAVTDPQGAVQSQVIKWGKQLHQYGYFSHNHFANLQSNDPNGYYLLPLTFPDKYCGITTEYVIPRGGYKQLIGQGFDEVSIHIGSLFDVDAISYDTNGQPIKINTNSNYVYELPQVFAESITGNNNAIPIQGKGEFEIIGVETGLLEITVNNITIGSTNWLATPKDTALALVKDINLNNPNFEAYLRINPSSVSVIIQSNKNYTLPNNSVLEILTNSNYSNVVNIDPAVQIGGDAALTMSNQNTSTNSRQYIIAKLEGKDLVVRLKMVTENPSITPTTQHRVAIFENLFDDDGLNHQLRLIYRPEGIEVYQDLKYLGLARWRNPNTILGGYNSLTLPHSKILNCTPQPLPDIFAYPNNNNTQDNFRWWDLLIGLPVNIDLFFKRVSVWESLTIDHPDSIDKGFDASGLEVEKYNFNFSNQQKINNIYVKQNCKVPALYKAPFPDPALTTITTDLFTNLFLTYPNNIISDINLVNQNRLGGNFIFTEDIQNFFKLPNNQIITIDSLFTFNGWTNTIHKDYEYDRFNKVYENYQLYSEQVLTYLALLPFMELVEDKFKQLVRQFIPIVINITRFGRLIKSLERRKVRYTNIHKQCIVNVGGVFGIGGFRITHGTNNHYLQNNNYFNLYFVTNYDIVNASNTPTITITTAQPHNLSSGYQVNISGVIGNTNANGTHIITVTGPNTFTIPVSGNGNYLAGGTVEYEVVWLNSNYGSIEWQFSNVYTADLTASVLTSEWDSNFMYPIPLLTAEHENNTVKLIVNPNEFLNRFNFELNDCKLKIVTSGEVIIDNIISPNNSVRSNNVPNSCVSITYSAPNIILNSNTNTYIYFQSENQPNTFIYLNSEGLNPTYIY